MQGYTTMPRYQPSPQQQPLTTSYNANVAPTSPLSLQERRQRNKAASAKYRAKKNQQHGEMRTMIGSLTKENELLQRQLDQIRRENSRLKTTCDRLRGKMMAEKMLKRMLGRNPVENVEPKSLFHHPPDHHLQTMKRFEEDIEFEEEEEWSREAQGTSSPADVEMKSA
ncbi:hypothetical protein DFQ28_000925 [Apophysomyces sp. BC1034]|nr:hypothetical protein DFQ30_001550 [Apophysomyces sp. BC1015]KAG0167063.1 hypothetical protein DFQ29_000667 [Apophysomyces sp. BC1021]KAG0183779.1 hypothetical protein DFQ28_000925 [Apophysomyces sp. BC1034]